MLHMIQLFPLKPGLLRTGKGSELSPAGSIPDVVEEEPAAELCMPPGLMHEFLATNESTLSNLLAAEDPTQLRAPNREDNNSDSIEAGKMVLPMVSHSKKEDLVHGYAEPGLHLSGKSAFVSPPGQSLLLWSPVRVFLDCSSAVLWLDQAWLTACFVLDLNYFPGCIAEFYVVMHPSSQNTSLVVASPSIIFTIPFHMVMCGWHEPPHSVLSN